MNNGKRFEQNFKNSMPDNVFFYRFRDGTASWNKGCEHRQSGKYDVFYNQLKQ